MKLIPVLCDKGDGPEEQQTFSLKEAQAVLANQLKLLRDADIQMRHTMLE